MVKITGTITFRWLNQVNSDRGITAATFRVAYALTQYFNRDHGQAFPSQETLAARLWMTKRGIQKSIRRLVDQDHLTVNVGKWCGMRSTYEMRFHDVERANAGSPSDANKGRTSVHPLNPERANRRSQKGRTGVREKGEPAFAQNYYIEPLSEPLQAGAEQTACDDAFERFYASYPRRVAKKAARVAFYKAIKEGADPEKIILGTARFARERAKEQDPEKMVKFTPHPASWLNAGRWGDEPLQGDVAHSSVTAQKVWISATSREWFLWDQYYRQVKGKPPPRDKDNGWRFDSMNPPVMPGCSTPAEMKQATV